MNLILQLNLIYCAFTRESNTHRKYDFVLLVRQFVIYWKILLVTQTEWFELEVDLAAKTSNNLNLKFYGSSISEMHGWNKEEESAVKPNPSFILRTTPDMLICLFNKLQFHSASIIVLIIDCNETNKDKRDTLNVLLHRSKLRLQNRPPPPSKWVKFLCAKSICSENFFKCFLSLSFITP